MVDKVTDPSKKVTDPVLLSAFEKNGIDPDYVEFYQDYAMPSIVDGKKEKGKSPYAKFYRDLNSNKRFMVVSGLPMVDADGNKNVAGWDDNGSLKNPRYTEKNNLFKASVDGTKVILQVKNDQPDGRKQGDKLTFHAQLYLDNLEVLPANTDATRLPVDPVNLNYTNNVLEWDYGICKRRLRIIEGRLLGTWVFASKPTGEVRINYNQIGDYRLRLGQFKVNDDEEVIKPEDFDELARLKGGYPVTINDSATFYPDAHVETNTVDGTTWQGYTTGSGVVWATIRNAAGAAANDSSTDPLITYTISDNASPNFKALYRFICLFDTSALADDCAINAAVLSVYGNAKNDGHGNNYDVNVYSSAPGSNTALVLGDYDSLGTTPYCDTAIDQAGWGTAGYNDFTLNATGRAAVSKVSITKMGLRNANRDVANVSPTWTAASTASYHQGYAAEQGAGYKPKLVVTYSANEVYDETGRLQVILAAQGRSDLATFSETAKLQVILAAQGRSDLATFSELGKLQVVLAAQGADDSYVFVETGKLQVVLAAQGESDLATFSELAKLQVILAGQGRSDLAIFNELAKLQVILAGQGADDSYVFVETGKLQVVLAAQGESEITIFNELARLQVILAMVSAVWRQETETIRLHPYAYSKAKVQEGT